jgi:hypothetical protein
MRVVNYSPLSGVRVFVFVLLGIIGCASIPSHQKQQINQKKVYYEPDFVAIEGTLTREVFPGPPEYEDISQGDKPEPFWILNISPAVTVLPKNGDDEHGLYPHEPDVRKMQLVFDYDKVSPKKFALKPGQKVLITGTLFHSVTIHHRTDVLLEVKNIESRK